MSGSRIESIHQLEKAKEILVESPSRNFASGFIDGRTEKKSCPIRHKQSAFL